MNGDYIKPMRHEGVPLVGAPKKPIVKFGSVSNTKRMAKKACKRCYGRGYTGFNRNTGHYEPCRCVREFPVTPETVLIVNKGI